MTEAAAAAGPWEGCEVEIGCGNGHFLAAYAASRPRVLLVGIDLKEGRCRKAQEKADKRGLANVRIVRGAAEDWVHDRAPGSVDAFHVYFPDPWPKTRHRKRRLFVQPTLDLLVDRLRVGGRIHFATDFLDYYVQAKVLVTLHPCLRVTSVDAPDGALLSVFGRRFTGAQKRIHLFSAEKVAAA